MSTQQMTLFQAGQGLSTRFQSLVAAGGTEDLGAGIRTSYAILSIKASRWRVKYKGTETPLMVQNPQTGQNEPVPSIEVVILKANGFLNKQFYNGKYVEGSNSPPDCFSLDGQYPSSTVKNPVHANCTTCPKNQWGSMVGDNGVKQKACRDSKKLAIVPLANIRNEALGGAMLFRVPPSALKDLSALAEFCKSHNYPYCAVAVRLAFDMEASHPKPTFQAFRMLTDDEADVALEMIDSDSVAAVLADNDVLVEHGTQTHGAPVPVQQAAAPAPIVEVPEPPTRFAPQPVAPPPPGMRGAVVQPFAGPNAPPPAWPVSDLNAQDAARAAETAPRPQAPPSFANQQPSAAVVSSAAPNPFFANVPGPAPLPPQSPPAQTVAPPPARRPRAARAPVVEVAAPPIQAAPAEPAPDKGQLDSDIASILSGLSAFTGGN